MADEQSRELAAMRRLDRIKALGNAAALIRAYTHRIIATELKRVAKRWGRRFLEEALILKSYTSNKKFWLTDPLWPVKNDNGKGDHNMKDKPPLVTPQARYHHTRLDQIDRLLAASAADVDIAYLGRLLALCSLPRSNPGNRIRYVRRNGPYTLYLTSGGGTKLPFGHIPRLLLAWVCTEAVRTQSRDLILGKTLSDFMRVLGIDPAGASFGRVRDQMKRLFSCSIELVYAGRDSEARVNSYVADRALFWWALPNPDHPGLFDSSIRLGEEFFNEIISHPLPIDMHILRALSRCSLGLDLYQWLSYRTFALDHPFRISWKRLYRQFGLHPDKAGDTRAVEDFRRKALREVTKIKLAWPGLDYATPRGALELLPTTTPSVPPLQFPVPPR